MDLGGGAGKVPYGSSMPQAATLTRSYSKYANNLLVTLSSRVTEATRALLAKQPRYGPENKQAFIAALPWREIEEIRGCRLQPQTASFVPASENRENHPLPDLQWWVSGNSPGTKQLLASLCAAAFEAFKGHLI